MKLVGATNNFVRIPFLLEGIWLGVLGAIIPMVVISIAYYKFICIWNRRLQGELFQLLNITPFIFQLNTFFMGYYWYGLHSIYGYFHRSSGAAFHVC